MIEIFTRNTSEALLVLAFIGALVGLIRYQKARRPDILLSFIIYMLGCGLREIPVWIGGVVQWSQEMVLFSGVARAVQIVGIIWFIHAALHEECPAWVRWSFLAIVLLLVLVL